MCPPLARASHQHHRANIEFVRGFGPNRNDCLELLELLGFDWDLTGYGRVAQFPLEHVKIGQKCCREISNETDLGKSGDGDDSSS